jgi:hypothetical protein
MPDRQEYVVSQNVLVFERRPRLVLRIDLVLNKSDATGMPTARLIALTCHATTASRTATRLNRPMIARRRSEPILQIGDNTDFVGGVDRRTQELLTKERSVEFRGKSVWGRPRSNFYEATTEQDVIGPATTTATHQRGRLQIDHERRARLAARNPAAIEEKGTAPRLAARASDRREARRTMSQCVFVLALAVSARARTSISLDAVNKRRNQNPADRDHTRSPYDPTLANPEHTSQVRWRRVECEQDCRALGNTLEDARASGRPTTASEFLQGRARMRGRCRPPTPGGPEDTELIRFANGFTIVVQYTDTALADAELRKSIWLELQTDTPDDLAKKIESFGIHAFDYFDKDHFYFQALAVRSFG